MTPADRLETGEVGYLITGIKDVARVRVGDTLVSRQRPATQRLPGYKVVHPMVFCGLFPTEEHQFADLRDALDKLKLNDAALSPTSRRAARRSASGSASASSGCCTWTSSASASSASTTSICWRRRPTSSTTRT